MKKIFYLASIAALAFSSCAKDETTEAQIGTVTGGIEIVAAMESNETRTQLVENGNGGFEIVWNGEDAIYVYENAAGTESKTPMAGTRFGLKGGSDGTATGSFYYNSNGGNVDKLSANQKYVAFYPGVSNLSNAVWSKDNVLTDNTYYYIEGMFNLNEARISLPQTQTYMPKSFAPGVVPAISKSFTVNADGNATVEMQPVVDYLMVEAKSTTPITAVNLQIINKYKKQGDDNVYYKVVPINGELKLKPYTVDYENVRYYGTIASATSKGAYTTLETGNLADNVSYKDVNTYVFTIPAGILGCNGSYEALVWFDSEGVTNVSTPAQLDQEYKYNDLENSYLKTKKVFKNSGTINGKAANARKWLSSGLANKEMENGIFWFNKADAPVEYNPAGDFIIKDELTFFKYFTEYKSVPVNAYVMEDLELDLTADNMKAVLKKAVEDKTVVAGSPLANIINAYVESKGKFPTIESFSKKFEGNGMSIVDIDRPLASPLGLFGNVTSTGVVNNINLSGLVAATVDEKDYPDFDFNNNGKVDKGVQGYILASKVEGTIDNVTVADLTGEAVIGNGTLAHFQEITIGEAGVGEELAHMIALVSVSQSFEIKAAAWSALEELGSVFHTITPSARAIVTLPEGAKYEDFTCGVKNGNGTSVLSVKAGNLSYWTGGKVVPRTVNDYYSTEVYGYSVNMGTIGTYDAIEYAENLAYMNDNNKTAYLIRNLDLNGANGESWEQVKMQNLNGADLTISNLGMVVKNSTKDTQIAPFDLTNATNVNFDGVNITIETADSSPVNQYISGLFSSNVKSIHTVNLTDLVVEAVATDKEIDYTPNINHYVGWFTAIGRQGLTIVNSDVINPESNIKGLHGMVGLLNIMNSNENELEAIFQDSNVSGINVTIDEVEELEAKTDYNAVASHVAVISVKVTSDISFREFGSNKPAFMYTWNKSAAKGTKLLVSYDYNDDAELTIEKKN